MLPFKDMAAAIDEPKSARMEQRTKAHVKSTIQHAAALLGVDETTFVTSVAYDRARATIDAHERTVVTGEDREVFLAALERPAEPTSELKEAVSLYRRMVEDAD